MVLNFTVLVISNILINKKRKAHSGNKRRKAQGKENLHNPLKRKGKKRKSHKEMRRKNCKIGRRARINRNRTFKGRKYKRLCKAWRT